MSFAASSKRSVSWQSGNCRLGLPPTRVFDDAAWLKFGVALHACARTARPFVDGGITRANPPVRAQAAQPKRKTRAGEPVRLRPSRRKRSFSPS